ncbi:nitrate ABC transporter substrate-binding protein [Kocuria dechangensis]|uniref:Nitrate ABC transporter substrate-binding protein n=1 Tax=Kocuria dechangensis TaxID=1176249 RepID=A0A917GRH0_9MICC|nr:nitrate ABC transporter substrate-binding protein [Kocuria dechangensis]
MRRPLMAMGVAGSVLALAACGGGEQGGEGGEMQDVTVGVIPIVDTAAIWLGKEQGFFEEEGLNLEIQTTSGGAAAVPGVVSGDFDFAFGNTLSVMVAQGQGLDLKYVTNGTTTSGNAEKDFGAVVVPADSDIQSPADLAGKTVSVNNLNNIGDTTIRSVVEEDGGDPSTIDFVEVGFPDAPAALDRGQVDAAWILDPFLTQTVEDGARVVSYNFVEFDPELDIAGYFTTAEKVEQDAEMVQKFQNAMNKSLEYANENPDAVREIVGTYTQIDEDMRQKMALPRFRTEFDREALQKLGDAAVKYGTLEKAPDLDALLP